MTGTTLMKIMIIMLCINSLLYVSGVRVIDTTNDFMSKYIDTSTNQSVGGDLKDVTDSLKDYTGSASGIPNFIDAINAVRSFINFVINIVLTPFGLFIGGGLPQNVAIIIGLPLILIMLLGVAYFMRSGG